MTKWVFASILCFMHAFSFGQRIYVQDHVVVEQSATFKSAVSTLSDFSNVSELKYGLKYDPDYLQLDSVLLTNIFNAGGLDIIHDEEKGLISFWFGREGTFALFSRNMVSYEFKAIGENLSCTELEFVAHEDGSEIYLVNNEITYTQDQFNIGNGSVYIKNLEEDPVVQRDYSAGIKPPLTAKINLDLPGCIHPNGAIGTDFYLQSCGDRSIKKIGRSGQELEGFGFDDFFDFFGPFEVAVPNEGSIIYDHVNESWILIEVFDDGNQATKVQVVLLKDDEGLELIHKTTIELPRNIWNPSFVLWKDKIVLSARDIYVEEFLFFFINLNDLRNGVENPRKNSLRIPIDAAYHFNHIISPATANNPNGLASNSPIALSLRDDDWYKEDGDYVEIMEFDIDWESAAPALKLTKIPLAPFNTQSLESIYSSSFGGDPDFVKSMILNPPQYYKFSNHESLVFCFTTDVNTEDNEYGIRWLELQRVEGGEWVKHQESTFAIPGRIRYFPSIAIDDKQNILLSYNTNASFASIDLAITGRRKEDPLNKMTFEENILRYGSGNFPNPSKHNLNSNQISLDKNENGFFWFTSNFSGGNCLAGVDFQTDNLDLGLVEITDLEELAIYDEENKIKLRIKNRGLDEVENYLVKVYLNEELVIEEERKDAFAFLEERIVELDQRLVFPEVGKYLIRVELELEGDELVLNNSLNAIVKRIEKHSAHINLMSVDGDCSTSENGSELRFEIINSGFENIDKAEILISLNNQLVEQFVQEMPIAYQEKMNFELLIEEEFEDENEYEITITEVESQGQIIPLNESISFPYHRSD